MRIYFPILVFLIVINNKVYSQSDTSYYIESNLDFYQYGFCLDSCDYLFLYENAATWIDTKYKYAGNSKNGVDCSGLVKKLYELAYNIELNGGSKDIFSETQKVNTEDLKEGDLLFFKTRGNYISHIALYLKDGYFIHSSVKKGVTINHLDDTYYKRTFYAAGRYNLIN